MGPHFLSVGNLTMHVLLEPVISKATCGDRKKVFTSKFSQSKCEEKKKPGVKLMASYKQNGCSTHKVTGRHRSVTKFMCDIGPVH